MASQVARLRRALHQELPGGGGAIDEATVAHLAQVLESGSPRALTYGEDEVVEHWLPFVMDLAESTRPDEESARRLCLRILRRFGSGASEDVPAPPQESARPSPAPSTSSRPRSEEVRSSGPEDVLAPSQAEAEDDFRWLSEWMERPEICIAAYAAEARRWCAEMGAADVDEVLEEWEEFCDALQLKKLERKRVQKDAESRANQVCSRSPMSPEQAGAACSAAEARQMHSRSPMSPEQAGAACSAAEPAAEPAGPFHAVARSQRHDHPDFKYDILEELGKGVTATVYRCRSRGVPDSPHMAAKAISLAKLRMRPDLASMLEKLHREVNILFSLKHPHVVSLVDAVETRDWLYLVMELVEGGDLFDHIVRNERLGEPEARYVFLQLIEAVQYIHSKGVVHRDLKPDNILVDSASSCPGRPHVKISDFGHSKLIDDGWVVAVTQVGTPHYQAPEVRHSGRSGHGYDERVDLWSLGVVLYVMLEGTYPFESDALEKTKTSLIQFKRDSSDQARELILGLIQVRPEDRLTLEACSRHAWAKEDAGPLARVLQVRRRGAAAACEREERFRLGGEPADLDQLRADLRTFALAHRSSAAPTRADSLGGAEVVVTWADSLGEPQRAGARAELQRLLARHAPAPDSPPTRADSLGGAGAGRRAGETKRLLKSTVRVSEDPSANLERRASPRSKGVRVLQATGQHNIVAGDLIVSINQVKLGGLSGEDLERTFEANFHDGAVLSFWRTARKTL